MADIVLYPETIEDNEISLTGSQEMDLSVDSGGTNELETTKIVDQSLPTKKIAVELISSALNTRSKKILGEFEFTESGALQIGKYDPGVSGDIKISPTGIVARNSSGVNTITIDGETGDAVFAGTIQSGTLIAGDVVVGDNNIRLDGENRRIIVYDEAGDARILIGYDQGGF